MSVVNIKDGFSSVNLSNKGTVEAIPESKEPIVIKDAVGRVIGMSFGDGATPLKDLPFLGFDAIEFNSIKHLKANTAPYKRGQYIRVRGLNGQVFYPDEDDTTSVSNGGTVIIDGRGIRLKRFYEESNGVSPKYFGAIGDGNERPVSQWLVGGLQDRGYANLAAIQADFPHVTSLTDQIDWAAFQKCSDFCFGTAAAPNATANAHLNRKMIIPKGIFRLNKTWTLTKVHGGYITGEGRFATVIKLAGNDDSFPLIKTNGFSYTYFGNLMLEGKYNGTQVLFDLDWDNTSGTALQSNTFENIYHRYAGTGLRIGKAGFMGSENLIQNCFFEALTVAGWSTHNYNALQNTMMGGNIQACGEGIWVQAGQANAISVGFQNNVGYDIRVDNSSDDIMIVDGCRSESTNCFLLNNGVAARINNCSHMANSQSAGWFYKGSANVDMTGCVSIYGRIDGTNGTLKISGCDFRAYDWIHATSASTSNGIVLENFKTGKSGSLGNAAANGYYMANGNIGLIGLNFQDWKNNGGWQGNWLRGAIGAFFQYPGVALSTADPSHGYLTENTGKNVPRLRNPYGIIYHSFRAKLPIPTNSANLRSGLYWAQRSIPLGARIIRLGVNITTAGTGILHVGHDYRPDLYPGADKSYTPSGIDKTKVGVTILKENTEEIATQQAGGATHCPFALTSTTFDGQGYLFVDFVVED